MGTIYPDRHHTAEAGREPAGPPEERHTLSILALKSTSVIALIDH